jgi:hypothetical protein
MHKAPTAVLRLCSELLRIRALTVAAVVDSTGGVLLTRRPLLRMQLVPCAVLLPLITRARHTQCTAAAGAGMLAPDKAAWPHPAQGAACQHARGRRVLLLECE